MSFFEKRIEPRIVMTMPLKVGDALQAFTRDVSPTGLYFELPGVHDFEGTLHFEMHQEEARMKFTASGTIVRIEHRPGVTGVAVQLMGGRLETTD